MGANTWSLKGIVDQMHIMQLKNTDSHGVPNLLYFLLKSFYKKSI